MIIFVIMHGIFCINLFFYLTYPLPQSTPRGLRTPIWESLHYTIYNPGGGIAPKSCLPADLKQQMKKKKKTQQNKQNTRRRKVSMAISDNTQELEDTPASFKSAVWEHFRFPVDYNNDGVRVVDRTRTVCRRCLTAVRYANRTHAKHAKSYQKASSRFANHRVCGTVCGLFLTVIQFIIQNVRVPYF